MRCLARGFFLLARTCAASGWVVPVFFWCGNCRTGCRRGFLLAQFGGCQTSQIGAAGKVANSLSVQIETLGNLPKSSCPPLSGVCQLCSERALLPPSRLLSRAEVRQLLKPAEVARASFPVPDGWSRQVNIGYQLATDDRTATGGPSSSEPLVARVAFGGVSAPIGHRKPPVRGTSAQPVG